MIWEIWFILSLYNEKIVCFILNIMLKATHLKQVVYRGSMVTLGFKVGPPQSEYTRTSISQKIYILKVCFLYKMSSAWNSLSNGILHDGIWNGQIFADRSRTPTKKNPYISKCSTFQIWHSTVFEPDKV